MEMFVSDEWRSVLQGKYSVRLSWVSLNCSPLWLTPPLVYSSASRSRLLALPRGGDAV